jgi:polysaccharide biosynthesis protein PslH
VPSLLFLTQRIPYPPIKGEKIRPLQILKYLRRSYDLYLGCLIDDPRDLEHVPTVRAMCVDAHFAMLNRNRAKIACLRGLLSGEPLSVTFYRDRQLAAWVQRVLHEIRPEVIFVCSSNMAPYVLDLRGSEQVCIVDLADVDSEKWRAYAENGSFPMSWVHRREWGRIAALETRIARECDWSTFVSREEAAMFARLHAAQADKIRAVGSGVDHVFFDPTQRFAPPFATERSNFVFTGTMDYPPNVDAVAWFVEAILPIVQKSAPAAQFHIVGSSPAPRVQALASERNGVFVTGRVPDVRPYLAYAVAAVAPMRVARGIQNKVLEAMAMAKTVVVTPDALEGIDASAGTEVLVADTPDAFAAACLSAVSADSAIGAAARRRVVRDYVWAERLRGFDPLLQIGAEPAKMEVAAS